MHVSQVRSGCETVTCQPKMFSFEPLPRYSNPFQPLTEYGRYEKAKVFLFTVTLIAPIRLLIITVLLLIGVGLSKLAVLGMPPLKSATHQQEAMDAGWRRFIVLIMRIGMRWIMFVAGFYWVNVSGSYDPRARIIVSTHHSIWDTIWLMYRTGCCEAAKHELFDMPAMGSFLRAFNAMPIDRRCAQSRRAAQENMRGRALDPRYPPMIVFPTATCTNSQQMVEFKRGAFECGVPIQPVGLAYPARHNDLFLLKNMDMVLYRTLCQFVNFHTVTFLPIYVPSEEEVQDSELFSRNVRSLMALRLRRDPVPLVFEDELLRIVCRDWFMCLHQHRLPMARVFEEFGVSIRMVEHWVKQLHSLDHDNDGLLSSDDIIASLKIEDEKCMKSIQGLVRVLKTHPEHADREPEPSVNTGEPLGIYDWLSGGNRVVPPRPVDHIHADGLAVHELVLGLLVLHSEKGDIVEKHSDSLALMYEAAFHTEGSSVSSTNQRAQLRQLVTRFLPTLFHIPASQAAAFRVKGA